MKRGRVVVFAALTQFAAWLFGWLCAYAQRLPDYVNGTDTAWWEYGMLFLFPLLYFLGGYFSAKHGAKAISKRAGAFTAVLAAAAALLLWYAAKNIMLLLDIPAIEAVSAFDAAIRKIRVGKTSFRYTDIYAYAAAPALYSLATALLVLCFVWGNRKNAKR